VRLHPTDPGHPENGSRLAALVEVLPGWRTAQAATRVDLERCHTRDYIKGLEPQQAPMIFDLETIATETTWEAVLISSGLAIEAARTGGFALVRPPGHHAERGRAMGFCFVNHVAVAARALQAEGVDRVAIVDIDVHHGNGTEEIFRDDDSVLYVSLHQWPFYPGTGGPDDQAETTVNVPLAAGAGDREYFAAFDAKITPAVERFAPDLVLVSAGFDAHEEDPLALMQVTEDGFRELARRCTALGPRVAAVLEGGYNVSTLPRLVSAALDGFES
jgi:acetoin utilization deacetylase AcuC-like enzyme